MGGCVGWWMGVGGSGCVGVAGVWVYVQVYVGVHACR